MIQLLSQLYRGPYKVLTRSSKFFTLQRGSRTNTVSIGLLKSVHGPDPVPLQPPHQGQPPFPGQIPGAGPVVWGPVLPTLPESSMLS